MERELPLNDCKSDGVGTDEYFGVLMNTRSLEIISTVKSLGEHFYSMTLRSQDTNDN